MVQEFRKTGKTGAARRALSGGLLAVLLMLGAASSAMADNGRHDGWRGRGQDRHWGRDRHDSWRPRYIQPRRVVVVPSYYGYGYNYPPQRVVVYQQPQVVYSRPPAVKFVLNLRD